MFFGKNNDKNKSKEIELEKNKIIKEEYGLAIKAMVMEEVNSPGTHPTFFRVERIGEGYFLDSPKTTKDAANFLNQLITHRSQIINICARGDDSLLKDYIVTFWDIEDIDKKIYNEIVESVNNRFT